MSEMLPLRCVARLREGYFLDKQVALWLFDRSPDGKVSVVTQMVLTDIPEGQFTEQSALLSYSAAQELMDSLWTCGIRPSEGSGSAGQLAAVQYHLEDMRRMVFDMGLLGEK